MEPAVREPTASIVPRCPAASLPLGFMPPPLPCERQHVCLLYSQATVHAGGHAQARRSEGWGREDVLCLLVADTSGKPRHPGQALVEGNKSQGRVRWVAHAWSPNTCSGFSEYPGAALIGAKQPWVLAPLVSWFAMRHRVKGLWWAWICVLGGMVCAAKGGLVRARVSVLHTAGCLGEQGGAGRVGWGCVSGQSFWVRECVDRCGS